MSNGNIVQCIGPVVDIQFPRDKMPNIYDALTLVESGEKSLENTDTLVDGNYSETLYHTGGEKTKEEIISESQTGITEAKTKVKELKQLNTKNHEMFNRSPFSD